MSGIVGIYNLDGQPVERSDVARMVSTLERRGPDGSGSWSEGSVGLGHTMLWNTPEEGIDNTSTFYQELHRHPPAHSLTVGSGLFSTRRYWSLDPTKEIRFGCEQEYTEAFREVFTEAVQCRLRSASPPGVMMSGGIDSTSIVGVARHLTAGNKNGPLRTFSAISAAGGDCSETRCIQAMLRLDGLQSATVSADDLSSFKTDFEGFMEQSDDLMDHWILHIPLALYMAARRSGVKVMLDGVPGDNVVAQGSAYISFLLRAGKWRTAVAEAAGRSRSYAPYYPLWQTLHQSVRAAFVPAWGRRLWRKIHPDQQPSELVRDSVIDAGFARRIDVLERLESLRTSVHPVRPERSRRPISTILTRPTSLLPWRDTTGLQPCTRLKPVIPSWTSGWLNSVWRCPGRRGCTGAGRRSAA